MNRSGVRFPQAAPSASGYAPNRLTGYPQRIAQFRVPLATTLLSKIEFYDSIAVVHRGPRELPRTSYQFDSSINRRELTPDLEFRL